MSQTAFEAFLKKHNVSTCRLAKLAGMPKSQVSEYRRNIHFPSRRSAVRIALALHLPVEDVLRQIPIRERHENHPNPPVYCRTCRRKMFRIPPTPEQFEAGKPSEDQTQAA